MDQTGKRPIQPSIIEHRLSAEEHWQQFYSQSYSNCGPSSFALATAKDLESRKTHGKQIVDLGCGSGQDTVFLAQHTDNNVVGLDRSVRAIKKARVLAEEASSACRFVHGCVFEQMDLFEQVSVVYARFFFHTLTPDEQIRLLGVLYANLPSDATLYIEVRSTKELFEDATAHVETHDGHYRCIIHTDTFCQTFQMCGFSILDLQESRGFALFEKEDPVILRVVVVRAKCQPISS